MDLKFDSMNELKNYMEDHHLAFMYAMDEWIDLEFGKNTEHESCEVQCLNIIEAGMFASNNEAYLCQVGRVITETVYLGRRHKYREDGILSTSKEYLEERFPIVDVYMKAGEIFDNHNYYFLDHEILEVLEEWEYDIDAVIEPCLK